MSGRGREIGEALGRPLGRPEVRFDTSGPDLRDRPHYPYHNHANQPYHYRSDKYGQKEGHNYRGDHQRSSYYRNKPGYRDSSHWGKAESHYGGQRPSGYVNHQSKPYYRDDYNYPSANSRQGSEKEQQYQKNSYGNSRSANSRRCYPENYRKHRDTEDWYETTHDIEHYPHHGYYGGENRYGQNEGQQYSRHTREIPETAPKHHNWEETATEDYGNNPKHRTYAEAAATTSHHLDTEENTRTTKSTFTALWKGLYKAVQLRHHRNNWINPPQSLKGRIDGLLVNINPPSASQNLTHDLSTSGKRFADDVKNDVKKHLDTEIIRVYDELSFMKFDARARLVADKWLTKRLPRLKSSDRREFLDDAIRVTGSKVNSTELREQHTEIETNWHTSPPPAPTPPPLPSTPPPDSPAHNTTTSVTMVPDTPVEQYNCIQHTVSQTTGIQNRPVTPVNTPSTCISPTRLLTETMDDEWHLVTSKKRKSIAPTDRVETQEKRPLSPASGEQDDIAREREHRNKILKSDYYNTKYNVHVWTGRKEEWDISMAEAKPYIVLADSNCRDATTIPKEYQVCALPGGRLEHATTLLTKFKSQIINHQQDFIIAMGINHRFDRTDNFRCTVEALMDAILLNDSVGVVQVSGIPIYPHHRPNVANKLREINDILRRAFGDHFLEPLEGDYIHVQARDSSLVHFTPQTVNIILREIKLRAMEPTLRVLSNPDTVNATARTASPEV